MPAFERNGPSLGGKLCSITGQSDRRDGSSLRRGWRGYCFAKVDVLQVSANQGFIADWTAAQTLTEQVSHFHAIDCREECQDGSMEVQLETIGERSTERRPLMIPLCVIAKVTPSE